MRSSRVAPFLLFAMLGTAVIVLGTVDGHCGVAVDQNSANAPAVQTPDQIDSAPSPETLLSGQTDPAPLSGSELPEEANQFDACAEDYYCYGYDHASQEEGEEKEAEYVDDTADSYTADSYDDDEYDYDGYAWDEDVDVEDAAEEEESWAAEDDYAYDEEDYWHDGDEETYDDQDDDEYSYEYGSWDSEYGYGYDSEDDTYTDDGNEDEYTYDYEDEYSYDYEDEYSDESLDYGMEDVAQDEPDDAEESHFSYEYDDYYSEYGHEYEEDLTEEESVPVDDTASDASDVEDTESVYDDGQWDDPYAYDSGEFEEPSTYTSEYDEYGEYDEYDEYDEYVDENEGDDDFTYDEYGAWESEYDESDQCESDAGPSECADEVEEAPAVESIEQPPADLQGYSEAYPEAEFAYPEEADDEMAEVDPWQDTTEEDATSDDYWAEYDYEYSYPETKYGSPDAMDEEIDLFAWHPNDLLLRQDVGILKILATQYDDPSGVRRATLNDYLEGLGVDAIDFTTRFENLSGIEVLGLADDLPGAAALLASFRLFDQGEIGLDEAVDVLRHGLENLSIDWIEAVDGMTAEAFAELESGSVETDSNEETSEWFDMSSSNNSVVGAVVSLAAKSCGSVTGVIRIISRQLAQVDTVDKLRGFGQTCVAAYTGLSVSHYQ